MRTVMNPALFAALEAAVRRGRPMGLGGRRVSVARAGQVNVGKYTTGQGGQKDYTIQKWGEAYQVCCPMCGDTKSRLNVNYMFGQLDPMLGRRDYSLAKCFNEGCQNRSNFRETMQSILMLSSATRAVSLLQAPGQARTVEAALPESLIPLEQLPHDSPALTFLKRRGFDPQLVARSFGLSYCLSGGRRFWQATGRMVFPVYMEGKLAGWQARWLGEDGTGSVKNLYVCVNCRQYFNSGTKLESCPACGQDMVRPVPKYYTMPGMATGDSLFNYDVARRWPYVIVNEGPSDPLQVGTPLRPGEAGPAVCIFGHSLSKMHMRRILNAWNGGVVVLMLDPDAAAEQKQIYDEIRVCSNFRTISVTLPDMKDPGDTPHDVIWRCVYEEAQRAGVTIWKGT